MILNLVFNFFIIFLHTSASPVADISVHILAAFEFRLSVKFWKVVLIWIPIFVSVIVSLELIVSKDFIDSIFWLAFYFKSMWCYFILL